MRVDGRFAHGAPFTEVCRRSLGDLHIAHVAEPGFHESGLLCVHHKHRLLAGMVCVRRCRDWRLCTSRNMQPVLFLGNQPLECIA